MFRSTVLDDRGRRVPLVPHMQTVRDGMLPSKSDRSQRVRSASGLPWLGGPPALTGRPTRAEVWRGIGYGVLALPVLLFAAFAPAWFAFHTNWPGWAKVVAMLPLGLVPALVTVFIGRRVAGRRIARGYAHASMCGSCGYDLQATSQESDGCRICPECGSAWRCG